MGNTVRPQMNTENAPKVTQPMENIVIIPKPELTLPSELTPPLELPLPEPCDPVGIELV